MLRGSLIIGVVGLTMCQVGCMSFTLGDVWFAGITEAGTPFEVTTLHTGRGQQYAESTWYRHYSMGIAWFERDESSDEPDWEELRWLGSDVLVGKQADAFLRRDNHRLVAGFHAFSRGDRVWFVRDDNGKAFAAADLEHARVYPWPGPIPSWSNHGGIPGENRVREWRLYVGNTSATNAESSEPAAAAQSGTAD